MYALVCSVTIWRHCLLLFQQQQQQSIITLSLANCWTEKSGEREVASRANWEGAPTLTKAYAKTPATYHRHILRLCCCVGRQITDQDFSRPLRSTHSSDHHWTMYENCNLEVFSGWSLGDCPLMITFRVGCSRACWFPVWLFSIVWKLSGLNVSVNACFDLFVKR